MIKLIDILNELSINNPMKIEDVLMFEPNQYNHDWSFLSGYIKNPSSFLNDLKKICAYNNSKYGKYLNQVYPKYSYYIHKSENINEAKHNKSVINKFKKIANILNIDISSAKVLKGVEFYKNWNKNMYTNYHGKEVMDIKSYITAIVLDNNPLVIFNKKAKYYVLTPSKKIISLSDINLDNKEAKKKITSSRHDIFAKYKVTNLDNVNKKIEFEVFDLNNTKSGEGFLYYKDEISEPRKNYWNNDSNRRLDVIQFELKYDTSKYIKFRSKGIYASISKDYKELRAYNLNDIILNQFKKQQFAKLEPSNDEEEVKKWINELSINNPIKKRYVYAFCSYDGEFYNLEIINENDILEENEDNDGPYIITKSNPDDLQYYLEAIQI